MTEKRFIVADRWIKDNCIGAWLNIDFNTITDANLCCDLLNQIEKEKRDNGKLASKLLEENEQLKHEIEKIAYANDDLLKEKRIWKQMSDEYTKLSDENEQLRNKKERYKRLSEIRQQQINNRILTIKEFINNCSDNKVRSVLKELFYSEVNEYDLSSENRKLLNENEQLKSEINMLKTTIGRNEGYIDRLTHKGEWR